MKRVLHWSAAVLLALIITIVLAFLFSPWPSVAVINYRFSLGDQASEAALAKHVPAGIVARRDIPYGAAKDEILDVYYQNRTNAPRPTIVWVHGGGFIAGSKHGIANYMKVLAGRGYTAIAVEYSKGPGTTYPKPVEQVNAALGFVVRHAADLNVDAGTLILAGDSAGAHISGQVALITTDPAYAKAMGIFPQLKANQLSALLLLSGVYDPTALNFEGDFGWFLRTVLWAYSGVKNYRADQRFPLMSVTAHVTSAFPPSFISSGNGDPLGRQAVVLAQKLRQFGVRVDALFFPPDRDPKLPHEYQFNLDDPAGEEALNRMLAFLDPIRDRSAALQLSR
jgi:acetyl esterase